MPSYTTSLRLIQPSTGEYSGTWGTQVNNGITALVDAAVAGTASITMTAADYTLSNNNGTADEARAMFLVLGGTPGAARNVICPAVSKLYFVTNNTGFAQTVKTVAGTGISVPNGASMVLRCDGTNVVEALNAFGNLTINTGKVLLPNTQSYAIKTSTGSSNDVVTLNASNVLILGGGGATDSIQFWNQGLQRMTLDSSGNLGIGTSSPFSKLDVSSGYITAGTDPSVNGSKILGGKYTNGHLATLGGEYSGGGPVLGFGVWPSTSAAGAFVSSTTINIGRSAYTLSGAGHYWYSGGVQTVAIDSAVTMSPVMTLDASGNLGLGVTPSAWWSGRKSFQFGGTGNSSFVASAPGTANYAELGSNYFTSSTPQDVYYATGTATRYVQETGTHKWYTAPSGTAGNAISFTQAMTLDASGNLLVGTTGNVNNYKTHILTTDAGAAIGIFQNNATTPYGINVYYGAASPNNSNANTSFLYCNDLTTLRIQLASNGGVINYQANNSNLSDRREKTDFASAKSYLDTICSIPVQTFKYIDQTDDAPTLGVVAQDVQAVAPELVMESNWGTEDNPKMRLSIYQTDLQYALMKCIQEQQELIKDLRARVAALEAK